MGLSGPSKRRYRSVRLEKRVLVWAASAASLAPSFSPFSEEVALWGPWWHGSGLDLAAVDATDLIVLLVESVGLLALHATCFGYVRLRGSLDWSSSDGDRRGLTLR